MKDDDEDSGTKDEQLEHESIMEDDITEDIVDEGNVSGSDEGNIVYFTLHIATCILLILVYLRNFIESHKY